MSIPANLTTNDQIVYHVICKRYQLSLCQIENTLAGILDPATIEQNNLVHFVSNLPRIKPANLGPEPEDQDCSICLKKYGINDFWDKDTAAKLPCGHIIGAECIKTWLKTSESCPLCRRKVYDRPVVQPHLEDPKLEQMARNLLCYVGAYCFCRYPLMFRDENDRLVSQLGPPWMGDSYMAFVAWGKGLGTENVAQPWQRYWYGWDPTGLRFDQFCPEG